MGHPGRLPTPPARPKQHRDLPEQLLHLPVPRLVFFSAPRFHSLRNPPGQTYPRHLRPSLHLRLAPLHSHPPGPTQPRRHRPRRPQPSPPAGCHLLRARLALLVHRHPRRRRPPGQQRPGRPPRPRRQRPLPDRRHRAARAGPGPGIGPQTVAQFRERLPARRRRRPASRVVLPRPGHLPPPPHPQRPASRAVPPRPGRSQPPPSHP